MRDIKFRAWTARGEKMIDLKAITPLALSDGMLRQGDGLFIPFREDIILMQYTGRKDKNGVEVYESDIILIHWSTGTDVPEIVSYDDKYAYWKYGNNPICELIPDSTCDGYKFEVIGNIYQNSELINALNQQGETNNG